MQTKQTKRMKKTNGNMTRVMNLDESGYQVPDFHQVTSKNESQPMERDAEFRVSFSLLHGL